MSELDDFGTKIKENNLEQNHLVHAGRPEKEDAVRARGIGRDETYLKRTQWSIHRDNCYAGCSGTLKKLRSGIYNIIMTDAGIFFHEMTSESDDILDFPSSIYDQVIVEIDDFWGLKKDFDKYGFLHRRGYLLYGPAGGGKSCLVQRVMRNVLSKDGIVIFTHGASPGLICNGLDILREIEPDRKTVCVFEDIDAYIKEWGESQVLSLLDGEKQIDKVVNIATTNYPEKLDKRIVARPRRFDRIIKVGLPDATTRKIYFEKKLKISGPELETWVEQSEELTFAALAELVISVKCLGNKFEDVISKLKEMSKARLSSSEFESSTIGFAKDIIAGEPEKSGH